MKRSKAELEADIKAALSAPAKIGSKLVIGHTGTGKPVIAPTRGAPDTNQIATFLKTKAQFAGWTKADHMDATRLLSAYSETCTDPKLSKHARRWSSVHWDIGGRWTSPEFDAYHGVSFLGKGH